MVGRAHGVEQVSRDHHRIRPRGDDVGNRATEGVGDVGLPLVQPGGRLPMELPEAEVQVGEMSELHEAGVHVHVEKPIRRARTIEALLASGTMPTGLVCCNVLTAIGAMQKARDLSIRIPEDLSIVAIHDSGSAAGCYYFVMDHISGQPFDAWAGALRDESGMSVRSRRSSTRSRGRHRKLLKVFSKICDAVNAAHQIGDDQLTQGRVDESQFTHGTSAQRMRWFRQGFNTGDARQCDTFALPYAQL